MNNKNIVKQFYEKEKNKLSISYEEFILLIEQLYESFENINSVNSNNNVDISSYKSIEITETSKTLELDDTDESTEINSLSSEQSTIKTSDISNSKLYENEEHNILNFINIEDNDLSKNLFKSSNVSESKTETLSYPSEFTSENYNNFFNNVNISSSFHELSLSPQSINKSQKNKKLTQLTQLTDTTKSDKSNNSGIFLKSDKIIKKTPNKININVNPNIEYNLNIDINNDIYISIE